MGQARLRGTKEERVAQAEHRKAVEIAKRIELVRAKPVSERKRYAAALGVLAFARALEVEM